MTSPTEAFFQALALRGNEPLPEEASGCVRFELTHGGLSESWEVDIGHRHIHVSNPSSHNQPAPSCGGPAADCVVHADRALFDGVVTGRTNAMAALLRGALVIEGDPAPLMLVQRLFPGPAGRSGTGRGAVAGTCS